MPSRYIKHKRESMIEIKKVESGAKGYFTAFDGEKEAKKCEQAIRNSSGLVFFISEDNSKHNWINIGRSFERFALKATQLGLNHAHLNMPCEEVVVREKLKSHLGLSKEQQPLLLLRIGYSEPMPNSFRRNVEEVLT